MGDKSAIEWTDATWNPITGCSHVSEGCRHCYAEALSLRQGWTSKPWTAPNAAENVKLHPDRLDMPLRWKRPRRIFVNSMSDLFHEQVPDTFINEVWNVMFNCPRHTFQILTKRPGRLNLWTLKAASVKSWPDPREIWPEWIHVGVSIEDQPTADERIPKLLQLPAAVRWISAEPLLGPVDLLPYLQIGTRCKDKVYPDLGWVVVGGESGPKARPMHPDWVRSLRDQCQSSGAAFNFKQWGEWLPNAQEYDCHQPTADYNRTHQVVGGFVAMCRVGKRAAGRLLDGRTWDEYPA